MTMLKILYPKQGSHGKIEIITCNAEPNPIENGTKTMESVAQDKLDTLSVESL